MKGSAKDFFNRESTRYERFVKRRDFVASLKEKVKPLLTGRVLDVGSGCISDFEDGGFDLYVALDISLGMLGGLKKGDRTEAVCGDARELPFRKDIFDLLIYRAVLHHLNPDGMGKGEMERRLVEVLLDARRVVKEGGKLVVIEPCLSSFLEVIEHFFAPFIRWFMRRLGLPYVLIFSTRSLSSLLKRGGWNRLRLIPIKGVGKRTDWIIPILGLPYIKIPRGLSPSKVYMIEGRRA